MCMPDFHPESMEQSDGNIDGNGGQITLRLQGPNTRLIIMGSGAVGEPWWIHIRAVRPPYSYLQRFKIIEIDQRWSGNKRVAHPRFASPKGLFQISDRAIIAHQPEWGGQLWPHLTKDAIKQHVSRCVCRRAVSGHREGVNSQPASQSRYRFKYCAESRRKHLPNKQIAFSCTYSDGFLSTHLSRLFNTLQIIFLTRLLGIGNVVETPSGPQFTPTEKTL